MVEHLLHPSNSVYCCILLLHLLPCCPRASTHKGACVHAGSKAVKLWRKAPGATVMAGSAVERDSPITASQTMRMHLNKVAWWLDLQASHNMGQLGSAMPCNPLSVVPADLPACADPEHDLPAALHPDSGDATELTKLPSVGQVTASSSLPDQLSGRARQSIDSRQPAKGSSPTVKGSSQPSQGSQPSESSQSLHEGATPEQGVPQLMPSAEPYSGDGCASAAATDKLSTGTGPPRGGSPASTSSGAELWRCSDRDDASHSKAECNSKPAPEDSSTHGKHGVGRLQGRYLLTKRCAIQNVPAVLCCALQPIRCAMLSSRCYAVL